MSIFLLQTQDGKKPKNKAPVMGPPLPHGPQGQMPHPQNSPYPSPSDSKLSFFIE